MENRSAWARASVFGSFAEEDGDEADDGGHDDQPRPLAWAQDGDAGEEGAQAGCRPRRECGASRATKVMPI
jgi:hypothetical protein